MIFLFRIPPSKKVMILSRYECGWCALLLYLVVPLEINRTEIGVGEWSRATRGTRCLRIRGCIRWCAATATATACIFTMFLCCGQDSLVYVEID